MKPPRIVHLGREELALAYDRGTGRAPLLVPFTLDEAEAILTALQTLVPLLRTDHPPRPWLQLVNGE